MRRRPPKQEQEEATTEVTEVAPGVLRTQLPISMPGLGHVNCYVLEDERGIAVVDPGLPGPESWDHLVDRLGRAGFAVDDVHTVVVTHSHPDHFGGAMRLQHEAGADIVTHDSFRTMFDTAEFDDDEDSGALDLNSPEDRAAAMERYFSKPTPWGGAPCGPAGGVPRTDARCRSHAGLGLRHTEADAHARRRTDDQAGAGANGSRCTRPATPTTTCACTTRSSVSC